jgi:hypothetical protein
MTCINIYGTIDGSNTPHNVFISESDEVDEPHPILLGGHTKTAHIYLPIGNVDAISTVDTD